MNELELVKDSGLHDFELVSLTVDYTNATVMIDTISPITNHVSHPTHICIHGFTHFSVSRQEPWGSGKYIFASAIQKTSVNTYRVEIQLNSGDLILIDYEREDGSSAF